MTTTQTRSAADTRWRSRGSTLVSYHFEEELPDENRIIISVDLLRELTSIAPGIFGKPKSPTSRNVRRHETTDVRRPSVSRSVQTERRPITPEPGYPAVPDHERRPRPTEHRLPVVSESGTRVSAESRRHVAREGDRNKDENATFDDGLPKVSKSSGVASSKHDVSKSLLRKAALKNITETYRQMSNNSIRQSPKMAAQRQTQRERAILYHVRNRARNISRPKKQASGYRNPGGLSSGEHEYIGLIGAEVRKQPVSRKLSLPEVAGNTCVLHEKEPACEPWLSPRNKLKSRPRTAFSKAQHPAGGDTGLARGSRSRLNGCDGRRDDVLDGGRGRGSSPGRHGQAAVKARSALARMQRKSSTSGVDQDTYTTRNTEPTTCGRRPDGSLPSRSSSPIDYVMTWLNETTTAVSTTTER